MVKSGKSGGGSRTHTQYRDANTGRFLDESRAKRMSPAKIVNERVPNSGHGDTGRANKN